MWYGGQDQLTVSVTSPGGSVVSAISGSDLVSTQTPAGDGDVEIVNASGQVASNGLNECAIYIFDAVAQKPPRAGTWQIKISGVSVTKGGGAYDIWLTDASMSGADGQLLIHIGLFFSEACRFAGNVEEGDHCRFVQNKIQMALH